MAFVRQLKNEIISNIAHNNCEIVLLRTLVLLKSKIKNKELIFNFKNNELKVKFIELLTQIFKSIDDKISIEQEKTIYISKDLTKEILDYTDISFDNKFEINDLGLNKTLCKKRFLMIVLASTLTGNIKITKDFKHTGISNTGYRLELSLISKEIALVVSNTLKDFDIDHNIFEKNEKHAILVRGNESIANLLATVNATEALLTFQNEVVYRNVRNNLNRENNCISGNIGKTISASIEQVKAIDIINTKIGIDALDLDLQNIVYLRIANPEESLSNLVKLYDKKISKSGMYHKLKKITNIAERLTKEESH